jgi:cyclin L
MGSVLLASKLLETPKRVREVVNVFFYLKKVVYVSRDDASPVRTDLRDAILDYVGEEYYDYRDRTIFAENVILRELGFHLEVYLPYGLLINYCRVLQLLLPDDALNSPPDASMHQPVISDLKVTQRALGYLNDSFYTPAHLLFQPNVLACAAISLACRDEKLKLPEHPPWYHVFDTFERGDVLDRLI